MEIHQEKNCDFLWGSEQFHSLEFTFFSNLIFNKEFRKKSPKKKKKLNSNTLKLNYLLIFLLNVTMIKYFLKTTSFHLVLDFLEEINRCSVFISKKLKLCWFFSFFYKNYKKLQNSKFLHIFGNLIENFSKNSFRENNIDLFFEKNWNLNFCSILVSFNNCLKKLIKFYENFSFFNEAQFLGKKIEKKKNMYKQLLFVADKKISEICLRKYNDLYEIKRNSFFIIFLGNLLKNGKYFELICRKNVKEFSLTKQILGIWFCEQEKWTHGLQQFIISIAINPQNNFVWFNLGFAALKKKNYLLATRSFLRIIQNDPFNKNAWNNLSSIFSIFFEKKNQCFLAIKEVMRNKMIPFFIFKKFSIFCLIPGQVKIKNLIEIFSNVRSKNFIKNHYNTVFFLKILIVLEEIYSKKFFKLIKLKEKKEKIINFIDISYYFLHLLFSSKFIFVKQKGFYLLKYLKKIKFKAKNLIYKIDEKIVTINRIQLFLGN